MQKRMESSFLRTNTEGKEDTLVEGSTIRRPELSAPLCQLLFEGESEFFWKAAIMASTLLRGRCDARQDRSFQACRYRLQTSVDSCPKVTKAKHFLICLETKHRSLTHPN